jgi:hypothetical protein
LTGITESFRFVGEYTHSSGCGALMRVCFGRVLCNPVHKSAQQLSALRVSTKIAYDRYRWNQTGMVSGNHPVESLPRSQHMTISNDVGTSESFESANIVKMPVAYITASIYLMLLPILQITLFNPQSSIYSTRAENFPCRRPGKCPFPYRHPPQNETKLSTKSQVKTMAVTHDHLLPS